ncbi:hypothetical protein TNIN_340031 [Trichonephila inaurata madagascariensis]|uniref:Uncharacterized protein n=1 Tax=Trichonephila inaurata madagascariensis TaxID=2747483 RepID=A0A8X6XEB5_9ARAC|nr:hypothetical protein TNIN_340031 [Trichonephila inaurata madagascariensis]
MNIRALPRVMKFWEKPTNKAEEETEVVTEGQKEIKFKPSKRWFQNNKLPAGNSPMGKGKKFFSLSNFPKSVPLTVHPTDIQDILAAGAQFKWNLGGLKGLDFVYPYSRTFKRPERGLLKTSVVPVFDGKSTAYHTVTESFFS